MRHPDRLVALCSFNPTQDYTVALYFETASVYGDEEMMKTLVRRMRQIGLHRIYFGSDEPPERSWDNFHRKVPLTKDEMKAFAANVAPWAQRRPAAKK